MAQQIKQTKGNPGMTSDELVRAIERNDRRQGFRGLRTLAYCHALIQRGMTVPTPRRGGKRS